ncbi:MAG TPA: alpha/beta hydrolase [Lachnospiraceae bacterium]|nr:alpha/beta hydrolase [Lachnospiraceae bacterium]
MQYIVIVILVLLALVVGGVLVISFKLTNMIVKPNTSDPDRCYTDEIAAGKIIKHEYEQDYHREDFKLQSDYGYTLSGSFIPRDPKVVQGDRKERVIVLVHGYTFCQFGSVKYINIFRELGFHCVIYDHRNHGYSDKAVTTMGYYEARDLKKVCDYVREKLGGDIIIGTHGESMGAATVMMNAPLDKKLSFVIEDCGYSDLSDQLAFNMKNIYHLPRFPFLKVASIFSRLRGGIFFNQVIPKNEVAKCEWLPMLFLHGEGDDFVPTCMVKEIYEVKKGYRRMRIFPNAAHAESYWNNQEAYKREVEEFLKEIKIL